MYLLPRQGGGRPSPSAPAPDAGEGRAVFQPRTGWEPGRPLIDGLWLSRGAEAENRTMIPVKRLGKRWRGTSPSTCLPSPPPHPSSTGLEQGGLQMHVCVSGCAVSGRRAATGPPSPRKAKTEMWPDLRTPAPTACVHTHAMVCIHPLMCVSAL